MTIQRMEHVGIVVDDLAAATEFFVELGLYRLCYVRGPEGIIIELAEQIG
jgi:catechol-2,3-dioxygenase